MSKTKMPASQRTGACYGRLCTHTPLQTHFRSGGENTNGLFRKLEDHGNTVSLHPAPEKSETVFCGLWGICIVMDYFNSCYSMKEMCDNIIEIILEKCKVLSECDNYGLLLFQ